MMRRNRCVGGRKTKREVRGVRYDMRRNNCMEEDDRRISVEVEGNERRHKKKQVCMRLEI